MALPSLSSAAVTLPALNALSGENGKPLDAALGRGLGLALFRERRGGGDHALGQGGRQGRLDGLAVGALLFLFVIDVSRHALSPFIE